MFGFLRHLAHAVAAVVTGAAAVTGSVTHPAGTNVSAGMEAGPACVAHVMAPGTSTSLPVSIVNSGNGWEKLDLSLQQAGDGYYLNYPLPRSWVSWSGGGWMAPGAQASATMTISVPGNARRGEYGGLATVTAYAQTSGFIHGHHVTLGFGSGAAAAVALVVGPGESPPPRAFCDGSRVSYYRTWPNLAKCLPGHQPGIIRTCAPPPSPNPRMTPALCHWTPDAFQAYLGQLRLTHNMRYGHCFWGGQEYFLNNIHYAGYRAV